MCINAGFPISVAIVTFVVHEKVSHSEKFILFTMH